MSANIIRNTGFKNKYSAISILLKYGLRSINGQHMDLLNMCRNETDYIKMTLEKSGSLVALACLVGVVLATNDYPEEIVVYSELIGLIGQINNDLMDIRIWNEKNDLINKKFTLPIIYLLNCKDDELQFIPDYYDNKLDVSEIVKNQELIDHKFIDTGAIVNTEVIKKIHQDKAVTEIKKLNIEQYQIDLLLKYVY